MQVEYTAADVARFWAKVHKTDGCWHRAGTRIGGYSIFHYRGLRLRASRVAWVLATGDTLTTYDVIGHTCDDRACVRNDDTGIYEVAGFLLPRHGHLFKGTNADNMADMAAKGRAARGHRHGSSLYPERRLFGDRNPSRRYPGRLARGEQNGSAKLTAQAALDIKTAYSAGGIRQVDLARAFNVSQQTISLIVRGEAWRCS